MIKVSYDKYDTFGSRFGHLFYKTPFSHYVIAVEYRFVGEQAKDGPAWAFRNSGVMFHGQPLATMKKEQDFPICIEAQFLGGRGDGTARTTANLCTPGTNVVFDGKLDTRHCINSTSKTFDGDQWVRAEIEVHGGGEVIHRVNGETVLRYEKPQIGGGAVAGHDPAVKKDGEILTSGTISLQAESHPGRVPQGGAPEPGGLHGQEGEELQVLLREGRPRFLPVQVGAARRGRASARRQQPMTSRS